MEEMSNIPWAKVITNSLWILGAAITLASFSYYEFVARLKRTNKIKIFKNISFKKLLLLGLILIIFGASTSILFQAILKEPEAIIIENSIKFPLLNFEGSKVIIIRSHEILMYGNGIIKSKKIYFENSKYEARIIAKGSEALGETAKLVVFIGTKVIADYFTSTEYKEKIIEFTIEKKQLKRLIIGFTNDYYDQEKKQDRNIWIKSIIINKKDNI